MRAPATKVRREMPTMPDDVHEVSDDWFLDLYKSDKIVCALAERTPW